MVKPVKKKGQKSAFRQDIRYAAVFWHGVAAEDQIRKELSAMYQIDREKNRINALETCKFSDLGFSERYNLQEWLANSPETLGEELLIIQKEFDGFDDTKERLDLLALDKEGNIVVIENKLDDSGKDVVWQVLKYASYCSSLTKPHIVDIYQTYLNRTDKNKDARDELCEFLEIPDLDEIVLNSGTNQRLMMVAANFRKEVTSTALWLLGHGVNVQCFKVTPYRLNEQLFLNIDQIIPIPEAKELMIGLSAKEADEKSTEAEKKHRFNIRRNFWEQALEALRESSCNIFDNINPTKDHWVNAGSGVRGVPYTLIFGKTEARVEVNISRGEKPENKFIFDQLLAKKHQIEEVFGAPLEWKRMDDKKASRITYTKPFDGYNMENWGEITDWLIEHISKLEKACKGPLGNANTALKSRTNSEEDHTNIAYVG